MDELGRHHGTRRPTSEQIAFADQQLIGGLHRAAGNVQLAGQAAYRRHALTGAQAAVGDGITHALIELLVDRGGLVAVRVEADVMHGSCPSHSVDSWLY